MILKFCPGCGMEKPCDEFGRNASRPDGLAYYCRICFAEKSRASYRRRREARGQTVDTRRPAEVSPGLRRCPRCEEVKPESEFPRNRSTKSGFAAYCKPCHNEVTRHSIKKNHGTTRHYHLTRRYGLGAVEVQQLLHALDWCCLICSAALTLKNAHVHHDHATGVVRGVLCFNCNGGLGQFLDDALTLRRAADYLERRTPLVFVIPATERQLDLSGWPVGRAHHVSVLEQRLRRQLAGASGDAGA